MNTTGRVLTCYRWEITKLLAQGRVRFTLLACLLAPFVFVLLLNRQDRVPKDTLYGRWVHDTGFATPLMLLGFAGLWVFPLLTSLVAGDIFASEDQHGTWKTILTRSQGRGQVFWGKTLAATTFALAVVATLALSCLVAGLVLVGNQPLEGLTGTPIPAGRAAALVLAAWGCALLPLLGFTSIAIMISVLTRNSAIGIVSPIVIGMLMQLYAFLNGVDMIRHVMLSTAFESWHGLFATHPFYQPLLRGSAVSVLYIAVCLGIAHAAFRRRDITGG
jgi:ABC-2 type transport system permease protein